MSATFRRDRLRRMVERGQVVLVGSYHFDDQYGSERSSGQDLPVAIDPGDWKLRKQGTAYLRRDEFEGACGRAWSNPNGTVTLYVHSNSNYTFRIKAEEASS